MRALIGGIHYGDRGAEWLASSAMMSLGVVLMMPRDTLSIPAYRLFDEFHFGDAGWAAVFLMVGALSLATLWWNGRSPRSSTYRRTACVVRFMLWSQLFLWLAAVAMIEGKPVPPDAGFSGTVMLYELISFYRAMRDVRYRR